MRHRRSTAGGGTELLTADFLIEETVDALTACDEADRQDIAIGRRSLLALESATVIDATGLERTFEISEQVAISWLWSSMATARAPSVTSASL